jgi:hypothetical protein
MHSDVNGTQSTHMPFEQTPLFGHAVTPYHVPEPEQVFSDVESTQTLVHGVHSVTGATQ